ncbi:MAG: hypothetical protein M1820_003633 [Bogoriella megaspora]|nr:MAG: hypothetical protein M1820_003633 [Bogoriella megaspora]
MRLKSTLFYSTVPHFFRTSAITTSVLLIFPLKSLTEISQGQGDQKFVPDVSSDFLNVISSKSTRLQALCQEILQPILSVPPYSLGFSSEVAQSSYYPTESKISREEIAQVSRVLEENAIFPENTRIRKTSQDGVVYEVLQASVDTKPVSQNLAILDSGGAVRLVPGDHSHELEKICEYLSAASEYAANETQKRFLSEYIQSFRTGSLGIYRDSQRSWITDKGPRVENIFGFVEPYRDPYGIRAEFEGLVAIADAEETRTLARLVAQSDKFIRRLPWAQPESAENNGKGPFEKSLFEPPDFSSIHTLAYNSSIIFPGINLPNYNDIRQETGFKNVIIANRMIAESDEKRVSPFIDPSEADRFRRDKYPAYYWWVVLHELLGHGTGKMMVQESEDCFNFEVENPPVDRLTGEPIKTWYKPGQTWTGLFGDLATTVDECRAELVGAYLMDDRELLALFGFDDQTETTAADLTYNLYLQLGTDGLRGLANFNVDDRAHFAILKCLLLDGGGVLSIDCDKAQQSLTVRVDRSKIISHGKPALGRMLLRLHIYRCTANIAACRPYYEGLSQVDGEYLEWRKIVLAKRPPPLLYVQANTFLNGDAVELKEYEPTVEGIIRSWVEREL